MAALLHRLARRLACALLVVAAAAPCAAQEQPSEFQSWQVPGWSFTPGVSFGTVYDTNVAIAGPDVNGKTASDTLFQMEPFGQLEFFSARTSFSSGYRGTVRRYFELGDLDTLDHRMFVNVRHRVTRRLTLFADESYAELPTTDVLQLNGLPFARVGSRYNAAGGGIDARVTKKLDVTARYEMSWTDFQLEGAPTQLTGGVVNGIRSSAKFHFSERASAGAEYGFRWADLNEGTRQFTYQDAGGLVQYQTGEDTLLEVAGGLSHLIDRSRDTTRTSPYVRVGLTHHAARAAVGADYRRSYSPSFFLGGSHLAQEVRGYMDMPFRRNRLYLQSMVAWRRADPVIAGDAALDTLWLRNGVGYRMRRWFRLEAYHLYMNQDNRLAGGQVKRQLLGAQVVVSEPVRIR